MLRSAALAVLAFVWRVARFWFAFFAGCVGLTVLIMIVAYYITWSFPA